MYLTRIGLESNLFNRRLLAQGFKQMFKQELFVTIKHTTYFELSKCLLLLTWDFSTHIECWIVITAKMSILLLFVTTNYFVSRFMYGKLKIQEFFHNKIFCFKSNFVAVILWYFKKRSQFCLDLFEISCILSSAPSSKIMILNRNSKRQLKILLECFICSN